MRILQYNLTTTTKSGGVETFVWELSRELAKRDHAVTVLGGAEWKAVGSRQSAVVRELQEAGGRRQKAEDEMGDARRETRDAELSTTNSKLNVEVLRAPFIDRTTFQRLPPLRRMYVVVKLLERASMIPAALPLVSGYDIVHMHKPYDLLLAPLLARGVARVVLHSHGEDFYRGDQLLVRSVSALLSCSRFNAAYTSARYNRPVSVVYNGFVAELFVPMSPDLTLRDSLLPREHAALLCVARLMPWKGVGDIIEALALLPTNTTLLVAGVGQEQVNLERQAQSAGLGARVRFLGDVPHHELPRYYALADIVVGASFASETFGMALCEAMACARPVVATRFGGFPEVVEDMVTGLLVPPRDPPALAAALQALLASPDWRADFGAAGRKRVLQLFTWAAVTDRVEAVYRAIM